MADISQTPANVAIGSSTTRTLVVQVGEAVTQGQPLYRDSTNSKYYRCDANDGAAKARVAAIALSPAGVDGYALVALPASEPGKSLVNLGATLTVGEIYVVSATVGRIAPEADLTTGHYVTVLGVATSTSLIDFQPVISNVQVP